MILNYMIRTLFRNLKASFVEGIVVIFHTVSQTRLIILIGYLFIFVLIVIIAWEPFLKYLGKTDKKSKRILAIVPLELIINIRHMYTYLETTTLKLNN